MGLIRNVIATADNVVSVVNGTLNAAVKAGTVLNTMATEQLERAAAVSHASCEQAKLDRKRDFAKARAESDARFAEEVKRLAQRRREIAAQEAKEREAYAAAGMDFDAFVAEIKAYEDLI